VQCIPVKKSANQYENKKTEKEGQHCFNILNSVLIKNCNGKKKTTNARVPKTFR
jgi:hypothetical protein